MRNGQGMHAMFSSSEGEALHGFIGATPQVPAKDVADGGLIFDMPEADPGRAPGRGSRPAPPGAADISFGCDDIEVSAAELRSGAVPWRGVAWRGVSGPVQDRGYGLVVTFMRVPGGFAVQRHQPRHCKAC